MDVYDRTRELSAPLLPDPTDGPDDVIVDIRPSEPAGFFETETTTWSPFEFLFGRESEENLAINNGGHAGVASPSSLCSLPSPTIDPFANRMESISSVYEWAKIVLCIPIAIVRLFLFGIPLLVGFLAAKTALQGWKDEHNPMPKWRTRLMWVTRLCSRFILFCFGYHWIKRIGKPAPRELAPIVVSNHRKAACDRFPRVLLFPEGTTTNGRALISFQLGAFIPGYPIQPVAVRYPFVHFDQSCGNISLTKLLFRMLTQFHYFMEVEYLPVILPLENKKETVVHFAARTSSAIASKLNVVQTLHSYGDLLLLLKASGSGHEKASVFMVEMARVESLFGINTLEAAEFLERFMEMNPDDSVRVQMCNFLSSLNLEHTPLSEKYLYGSGYLLKQRSFQPACEVIFDSSDDDRDGFISNAQFEYIVRSADPRVSEKSAHKLCRLFDLDGDGLIGSNHFMICLHRNPVLIGLFHSCGKIQTVG